MFNTWDGSSGWEKTSVISPPFVLKTRSWAWSSSANAVVPWDSWYPRGPGFLLWASQSSTWSIYKTNGFDKLILGYLNDTNAAKHSVNSDIFYTVIHLQLHAWWCIDDEVWQGIMTKDCIVIRTVFAHKTIHINLPFTRSPKIERSGNCRSRNLTYKFCTGTHYMSRSRILQLKEWVEDASITMYENAKAFSLNSCLEEKKQIAAYIY